MFSLLVALAACTPAESGDTTRLESLRADDGTDSWDEVAVEGLTAVTGSAAVEPDHLERGRERVRQAAAGIRTNQYPPAPEARKCGFCSYRIFCRHNAARRG